MPKAILFHNPRCSKSRQALEYMQQQHANIELDVIEYLKQPPSLDELESLFNALNIESAHTMIRPKEKEYNEAGLNKNASNESVLEAISNYPKLLERPIVSFEGKAAIGRPLSNIEALMNV
ncbi:arsenate reductase (glutaredoxin) [Glaciecola sp. 2405UD65-10]|jgi:arsenate reductase|uniref:arsenate reductase (glutaredoxin) n=1 Tax=Glaciecola sp. 2405UD65-10 TaxID=3397244 RepID=UPI003B5BED26